MRIALSLVFIISYLNSADAQEGGCALKLTQLPQAAELRGFHLGMTLEQVKSRLPKLELGPTDEFGVMKTSLNPEFSPDYKSILQGVRTISFEFFDGKLYSIGIGYNSSFKWQTLDEFLPEITKALKLPFAWRSKSWRGQELDCIDFQVTVRMIGGSPSLLLLDKASKQEMETRLSQQQEE